MVRARAARSRRHPGRRPRSSTSPRCPAEGEPLRFSFEVAVRPAGQARRLQGPRGRAGRGRGAARRPSSAELERLREGFASLEPVEREAAEGDFLLVDYAGTIRRRAVRGRRGARLPARARHREPARRLRGGARRRAGGRRARGQGPASPTTTSPSSSPARTPSFEVDVKEVREKELPDARRRFRRPGLRVRHARRAARGHRRQGPRGARARRSRSSSARRRSTPRSPRRRSRCPDDVVAARATEMWERVERPLAGARDRPRELPADAEHARARR